jgi:hypothetical protein
MLEASGGRRQQVRMQIRCKDGARCLCNLLSESPTSPEHDLVASSAACADPNRASHTSFQVMKFECKIMYSCCQGARFDGADRCQKQFSAMCTCVHKDSSQKCCNSGFPLKPLQNIKASHLESARTHNTHGPHASWQDPQHSTAQGCHAAEGPV